MRGASSPEPLHIAQTVTLMTVSTKFRLACIVLLWGALCYLMLASQPFTPRVGFVLVASAIIVFVPVYKKYFRKNNDDAKG